MGSVSGIDLNLLSALGALLEERNLTRAGAKLSLSQPTMSGALARLRRHFGDELLVREGREYILTPAAQRLQPTVRSALNQVERTFGAAGAEFDPATSRRQFSIGLNGESILMLSGFLRRVHQAAPHARLDLRPITAEMIDGERGLLQYDLMVAAPGSIAYGQPEVIYRDRLVLMADPANPRLRDGQLSLADLAALPHAQVRRSNVGVSAVTEALDRLGVTRNVVLTTLGWLPLPFMIAGTDLIAVVPERFARTMSGATGVTVIEPPFGRIELVELAWWHPMHPMDPALSWLRELVKETASQLDAVTC